MYCVNSVVVSTCGCLSVLIMYCVKSVVSFCGCAVSEAKRVCFFFFPK